MYLRQQLLERRFRGVEYRETNDLETEIWRACQRFNTAMVAGKTGFGMMEGY
jgi:ribulose bisphosphate carboxylase small subunit